MMRYPIAQIGQLGDDATLRSWVEGAADVYGDPIFTSTDTPITVVKSFVTNTRVPFRRTNELGESRVMDYEFFCKESVTIPDTHQENPPHLIHEGNTYRILDKEPSKIGIQRLIVELLRVK